MIRVAPDVHVRSSQSFAILLNLTEDPGIRGSGAADHYGIASSGGDHGARVFRTANVAIPNYRDFDRVFYSGDPLPASIATVALFARASMERNCAQAAVFGNFR